MYMQYYILYIKCSILHILHILYDIIHNIIVFLIYNIINVVYIARVNHFKCAIHHSCQIFPREKPEHLLQFLSILSVQTIILP